MDESYDYPTPPPANPHSAGTSTSKYPILQHRRTVNANANGNDIAMRNGKESPQLVVPSSISVFKANRKTRADSVDSNNANLDIVHGEATLPYDVDIRHTGQVNSPTKRHNPRSSSTSLVGAAASSSASKHSSTITHNNRESNADIAPLLVKFGSIESSPVCLQLNSNGTGFVRWTKQGIYIHVVPSLRIHTFM